MNTQKNRIKVWILTASLVLLLLAGAGAVIAYITATDEPIENTFTPAVVACSVEESFDGNVKTDVSVKNTGNVSAYIRVALVVTWKAEAENAEIFARAPKQGVDYIIEWGDESWVEGGDGFWYCTSPVMPEMNTPVLIRRLREQGDAPEGYRLSVEILATAIQSEPAEVVAEEWGVVVNSGKITPIH